MSSGEHATDSFPEGAALTLKLTAETAGKYDLSMHARGNSGSTPIVLEEVMELKVNNADVAVSGNVLGRTFADYALGEVDLVKGENTIVITHKSGTMPNIDYLRAVPKA